MAIYAFNSPAKQWIFQQLHERYERSGGFTVCDLACGAGSSWKKFLLDHPMISYRGYDTDRPAIAYAKNEFANVQNAEFHMFDVQNPLDASAGFDVVTALSALEHIVRLDRFMDTVFFALRKGGVAYLNYDDGHFTSRDLKERLMVPVSQLLARIGIEGPFMKRVQDADVIRLIQERGGIVRCIRKHNLGALKGFMKSYQCGLVSDADLQAWFDFEAYLNAHIPAPQLSPILGATIVVAEKL